MYKLLKNTATLYCIIFITTLTLYAITCAPAILWQDSGLLVYRIWNNDIQGNLGLAVSHPLYIIIGIVVKNISIGDLAHRINFISAIFGAFAIANLFLLLKLWLHKNWPSIIGAVTLALSWTFWQQTAIAEVYTLFAAQFFGELILLFLYFRTNKKSFLFFLAFLNGLSIANHLWAIFASACYVILILFLIGRKQMKIRHLIFFISLWILGAFPFEYIIIKNIILSGQIKLTLASAFFGNMWKSSVLNSSVSIKMVLENMIFIILNFPTPNIILFFVGLSTLRKLSPKPAYAYIIIALLISHFIFAFRYPVPDRYVFFLPFYCLSAILIALGANSLLNRFMRKKTLITLLVLTLLPFPVYYFTPNIAKKVYKPLGQRRHRPYRDEYVYFLQPWKTGYRGAERFANETLDTIEKNSIIYADSTTVHALLYIQQVYEKREDVRIISDHDKSLNAPDLNRENLDIITKDTQLYVVSPIPGYCPDYILEHFEFIKKGIIYKAFNKKY
ncbi:MAG: protein O-mannosyl-transferase family [Planctomycetota bacterium]|jgi:hypothetical protein